MTKPLKPAVKILRETQRLLKRVLTKVYQARDKYGNYTHWQAKNATCWCLLGAFARASKGATIFNVVGVENVYKVFGTYSIGHVNDNAKDVEEVLSYLKHLEDLCA